MNLEFTLGYNLANSDGMDGRIRPDGDTNTFTGKKQDGFYNMGVGISYYTPSKTVRKERPAQVPVVTPTPVVQQRPVDIKTIDSDGDGISDYDEITKYKTNPLLADTDKGSVNDAEEIAAGTNPRDPRDDVLDLTEGATFSLEGILWDTAQATILPESLPILEKAYTALAANPEVKVLITGHTDNVGNDASNMTLSLNRANSVRSWLIEKGIDATRIRAEGRGETMPRATNDTEEGRAQNRRIEFVVE